MKRNFWSLDHRRTDTSRRCDMLLFHRPVDFNIDTEHFFIWEQKTRNSLWEVIFTIKSPVFCFIDSSLLPEHSSHTSWTVTTTFIIRSSENVTCFRLPLWKQRTVLIWGEKDIKHRGGFSSNETLNHDIVMFSFHKSCIVDRSRN